MLPSCEFASVTMHGRQVGTGAAAAALLILPALWLLRRRKGRAEGETFVLRSSTGIEVRCSATL